MKSNIVARLAVCVHLFYLAVLPSNAAPEVSAQVAVAALNLPSGFSGEVHWSGSADSATESLQLSTRYFSKRLKVTGGVIRFYENPVSAGQTDPVPKPFLTVVIPAGSRLAYLVLRSEAGENGTAKLKATIIRGEDWKAGCLRVHNACREPVGIIAGKKLYKLASGKSSDFLARQWKNPFPVKIYRFQPESKLVFSSTWRVADGRRELCFIGATGNSVKLRSLIEFKKPPPKKN